MLSVNKKKWMTKYMVTSNSNTMCLVKGSKANEKLKLATSLKKSLISVDSKSENILSVENINKVEKAVNNLNKKFKFSTFDFTL